MGSREADSELEISTWSVYEDVLLISTPVIGKGAKQDCAKEEAELPCSPKKGPDHPMGRAEAGKSIWNCPKLR